MINSLKFINLVKKLVFSVGNCPIKGVSELNLLLT